MKLTKDNKPSIIKAMYKANCIQSIRLCKEREALILFKKRCAIKEAIEAHHQTCEEILRIDKQLDFLWNEQIELFEVLKKFDLTVK